MQDWEGTPAVLGQVLELLAHDLRNPLSALVSNLGYVKSATARGGADPDVVDAVNDGLTSCDGLGHIIDNLGVFAHLLRAAPQALAVPSSAVSFVNEAMKHVAKVARNHGTTVELAAGEAGSSRLSLPAEPLSRALVNLLLNAVHCSPRRSHVKVELGTDDSARVLHVRVHDQGVSLHEVPNAFDLATQLASKTAPRGRYTRWLGLYMVNISARAMGGTFQAEAPAADFSSCLVLTLPVYSG